MTYPLRYLHVTESEQRVAAQPDDDVVYLGAACQRQGEGVIATRRSY